MAAAAEETVEQQRESPERVKGKEWEIVKEVKKMKMEESLTA